MPTFCPLNVVSDKWSLLFHKKHSCLSLEVFKKNKSFPTGSDPYLKATLYKEQDQPVGKS